MKYFFGIGLIFVLLYVTEVSSLLNLSKTTAAPIKLLGSATTTIKKPLQKSTNSLTSSLSKLLGLTPTKPKENDSNENVIKNSDQSSSAKIETEAENITTIISDLIAIQDKLNVKLPTESETVKEDVQEYKVQNEEDENEQELHETIPDIKQEALLTVSIVSDLDIKILNPSTIDIDRTSSSVSDTESKQPVAESPLPSIQDDIGSLNESVSEELSIVDDSAKIVQSESILESTEPTVLENLPNVDKSDPVVANTIKPVTDAESLEELLEIPPLSQQEIQIVDVSPVLDGETTESSLSQLPLTSLESEALQSNGPKRPTEEADTLINVDPAVNIQPEVPTDVPLGIPSGNILTKSPKVTIATFEKILPNLRFEYQPIPENSFGQFNNFYTYRSRPLIDIHDNEINLVEIVFD